MAAHYCRGNTGSCSRRHRAGLRSRAPACCCLVTRHRVRPRTSINRPAFPRRRPPSARRRLGRATMRSRRAPLGCPFRRLRAGNSRAAGRVRLRGFRRCRRAHLRRSGSGLPRPPSEPARTYQWDFTPTSQRLSQRPGATDAGSPFVSGRRSGGKAFGTGNVMTCHRAIGTRGGVAERATNCSPPVSTDSPSTCRRANGHIEDASPCSGRHWRHPSDPADPTYRIRHCE